jgi:hypothetical protein
MDPKGKLKKDCIKRIKTKTARVRSVQHIDSYSSAQIRKICVVA